jgi:predicted dehydrogenase
MTITEPLRIGVLGASRIADLALVKPVRATGHRIVAVAARDRSRAEDFAGRIGAERVVDTYAELIADPEVEVVYNPLVNSLHGPYNLDAIRAGKHVLTEKPSASNAEEAREVRDAVASAGVTFLEGFHYLHHPLIKRMHALLESGELGELRSVEVVMLDNAAGDDDPRWVYHLSGGALMDLGCYALHAQRMLAPWAGGAPRLVAARVKERSSHPGVDERIDVDLEFPGGASGSARIDMAGAAPQFHFRIVGTRGEVTAYNFVQPHVDDRLSIRVGDRAWVEELGRRSSYTYQLDALAGALRGGMALAIDADDAVDMMELIDATYRAAGLSPRRRSCASAP